MTNTDKDRPKVSLSQAAACRMKLWLNAHDYEKEEVQPNGRRTFDLGHIIEAAMLRGVPLVSIDDDGGITEQTLGPWWKDLGEVRDNKTGQSFTASMDQLSGFQRIVSFAGYSGHLDALLTLDTGKYILDVKSTQGYGYDRALTQDLDPYAEKPDPFARIYVGQLNAYMAALMAEGEEIAGGILLYFNKEQSACMARFIEYNPRFVEEIRERLACATNTAEPEPDWKWDLGAAIPTPCGYCDQKQNCAQIRGLNLTQQFAKKGKSGTMKPEWVVA